MQCNWKIEDTHPTLKTPTSAPSSSANSVTGDAKPVTVSYLTEQTSHHPPVSAFYVDCPEKGISAKGYDQLSAKFTGTSVRPSMRIVPSVTKPSMRGSSGFDSGGPR